MCSSPHLKGCYDPTSTVQRQKHFFRTAEKICRILLFGALAFFSEAVCRGGVDGSSGTTPTSISLDHLGTTEMEEGTHRPEIFVTEDGDILLAVVHPLGPAHTEGSIKHRAYWLNSDLEIQGEGFTLTTFTEEYGDPADHRVLLVDEEIVVVYQSLLLDPEAESGGDGPAENNALNQSLMLARFTYDGVETFRGAIVAHATDFTEDNFPDHCIVWDGSSLIVSTGSDNSAKFRMVNLDDAAVSRTEAIEISADTIGSNIGNSLFWKEGELHIASGRATPPSEPNPLLFAKLDTDFSAEPLTSHTPEGEDTVFPTGTLIHEGVTFIAYSAHETGSSPDIMVNPYEPRLAAFDGDWNLLLNIKVSTEAGAGHVHPTVAVRNNVLYYSWSRKDPSGGPAPQVLIEQYRVTVMTSTVDGNGDSLMAFTDIWPVVGGGIAFEWLSSSSRCYTIRFWADLLGEGAVVATNVSATPPANRYTNNVGLLQGYYRVELD